MIVGRADDTPGDGAQFSAGLPDGGVAFVRSTQDDLVRFLRYFVGADQAPVRAVGIYRRLFADGVRHDRLDLLRIAASEVRSMPRLLPTPDLTVTGGIDRLVRDLAVDQRIAFVLTQMLGLDYRDAARVDDVSPADIRRRVARAREELVACQDSSGSRRHSAGGF